VAGIVASGITAGSVAVGATPAFAHDELIGSNPKDGSAVVAAPRKVTLYFEEPPGAGPTSLRVVGPSGEQVVAGPAAISGAALSAPLRRLTAKGRYRITFSVMSDDGHPVSGTLTFTLAGAATDAPASAAERPAHPSSMLGWIAGGTVAFAVAVALTVVARRPRPETPLPR
jgi:methionine-rich copper-binding protein CopC